MFIVFFKRAPLVSFLILSVSCTSLQVEKSIDALGNGISDSVQSRIKDKPQDLQDHDLNSEDLASGILNMLLQNFVSLFSSEND
ncbi:hypothetical protein D5018_21340 [Parashewanella curva]|uniref:Lipoprotein n=1 Tax=Parashewanella curva TaxID=2338552 RepID=A0A3L8PUG7_9GAMM|nr:hypothetical protein [Parashewanella curva]RLV57672.1 hypothetical protein D5018_21340 [Parashewanella curva]